MALTIYPNTDWDSYVSLIEAEELIINYVVDKAAWNALDDTDKELFLRQSSLLIKNKIDFSDDEASFNLKLAVVYLSVFSIGRDMTNSDGKDNIKILDIDGAVKKEFFTKGKRSNSVPSIVIELLQEYGFRSNSSFSITRS